MSNKVKKKIPKKKIPKKREKDKKVKITLERQKDLSRIFLEELYINNFKGIEDNEKPIKFAPKITLLFGKNSAGKSSILQAIKLIQQSSDNDNDLELNPKQSYPGGFYFPSFKELVSKKDTNKSITLGITANENDTYGHSSVPDVQQKGDNKKTIIKKFNLKNNEVICSEVDFYSPTDDKEKFISLKNEPFYLKGLSGEKIYTKSKISFIENKYAYKELFIETFKNKKKIISYLERAQEFRDDFYELIMKKYSNNDDEQRKKTSAELNKLFSKTEITAGSVSRFNPASFQFPVKQFNKKKIVSRLDDHKKFIENMKDDYQSFLNYISKDIQTCKKFLFKNNEIFTANKIQDKIPRTLNEVEEKLLNESARSYSSLVDFLCFVVAEINGDELPSKMDFKGTGEKDLRKTLNPQKMISYCSSTISNLLNSIYIFQGQKALPHQYENISVEEDFVGYNYEFLHKVIENNKLSINKWLKHFDYDFKIETETGGPTNVTLIQHKKENFKINYKYGGLGAENVLPVIAQSVAAKNKVIIFEEPERRAHPGLQVKLADLFVQTSKHNQFIIETHSENLLLGILKNIRDGKISHKDVQVSYTYIEKGKTKIDELSINEKGNFETNWRHGFFTERLDLI